MAISPILPHDFEIYFQIVLDVLAQEKFTDEILERLHRRLNEDKKDYNIVKDFFIYYYSLKLRGMI